MNTNIFTKLFFTIGILLLGVSSFYYFVFYLPNQSELKKQQQESEYILSMKKECQELAKKIIQENEKKGIYYTSHRFGYNRGLNTCLYAYTDLGESYSIRRLEDILNNETIIYSALDLKTGKLRGGLEREEYFKQEEILFNNGF